jgi:hypothetical protein
VTSLEADTVPDRGQAEVRDHSEVLDDPVVVFDVADGHVHVFMVTDVRPIGKR